MSEKKLWNIFHQYQDYEGNYDQDLVGTVSATQEEVDEYCKKWSKEKTSEDGMMYGIVSATEVQPDSDLSTLVPYKEG